MIRVIVKALFLMVLPFTALASEGDGEFFSRLDKLAASQQLEAVYGESFPKINPYGSYGSPYVLDISSYDYSNGKRSILFLARKKHTFNVEKTSNARYSDLVNDYDYFLVFATSSSKKDSFVVKDVIKDAKLKGMTLYSNRKILGNSRKDFHYIDYKNKKIAGSKLSELDYRKLSNPVLISGKSSTTILFHYDGLWIKHVETH